MGEIMLLARQRQDLLDGMEKIPRLDANSYHILQNWYVANALDESGDKGYMLFNRDTMEKVGIFASIDLDFIHSKELIKLERKMYGIL